mmetsp:Transcript_49885/g.125663  ORF Transcript_49885/g.125663 Transcript_49885/m.125663 type:complete len:219 (+) Transcript_49885:1292-1948(+)
MAVSHDFRHQPQCRRDVLRVPVREAAGACACGRRSPVALLLDDAAKLPDREGCASLLREHAPHNQNGLHQHLERQRLPQPLHDLHRGLYPFLEHGLVLRQLHTQRECLRARLPQRCRGDGPEHSLRAWQGCDAPPLDKGLQQAGGHTHGWDDLPCKSTNLLWRQGVEVTSERLVYLVRLQLEASNYNLDILLHPLVHDLVLVRSRMLQGHVGGHLVHG